MARERRGPIRRRWYPEPPPRAQDGRLSRPALHRRAAAAAGRARAGSALRTRRDGDGAARERGGTPHDAPRQPADGARSRRPRRRARARRRPPGSAPPLQGTLRPVINATGVVIHTNLGRAPLADGRAGPRRRRRPRLRHARVRPVGRPARLARRARRARCSPRSPAPRRRSSSTTTPPRCCWRWPALARGREVVISRGELVEIGGGFRVPDVMAQSGASLREVGTTNRTRLADLPPPSVPATALWLRVHPSNFRIEGFTERPALAPLVAAAHAAGVAVVEDLGCGQCRSAALDWEPTVQDSVAAGVDVVCFSGDKLLGGPQAGLIIGRAAPVDRLRRHPLMRALRVDKLIYAALEATLVEHWPGAPPRRCRCCGCCTRRSTQLRARAEALRGDAGGARLAGVGDRRRVGGGRRQRPRRRPAERAGAAGPAGLECGPPRRLAARPGDADHRPHPRRRRRPGSAHGGRRPGRADSGDTARYRIRCDARGRRRTASARAYTLWGAQPSPCPNPMPPSSAAAAGPSWPGQRTVIGLQPRPAGWERGAQMGPGGAGPGARTSTCRATRRSAAGTRACTLEMAVKPPGSVSSDPQRRGLRAPAAAGRHRTDADPAGRRACSSEASTLGSTARIVAALLVALAGGYRLLRTSVDSFAAVTGTLLLWSPASPTSTRSGSAARCWPRFRRSPSCCGVCGSGSAVGMAAPRPGHRQRARQPGDRHQEPVADLRHAGVGGGDRGRAALHGALSWRHGVWPIVATVGTTWVGRRRPT